MMYHFCAHGAMPEPCDTCIIPRTSQEIDKRLAGIASEAIETGELHYTRMKQTMYGPIPDWDLTQPHSLQTVDGMTYMMEHNTLTSVIGEWKYIPS